MQYVHVGARLVLHHLAPSPHHLVAPPVHDMPRLGTVGTV